MLWIYTCRPLVLDVMSSFKIMLDFGDDQLVSKTDGWTLPLVRKYGHAYLVWTINLFYTATELRKIHRHFYHLIPGRLYLVLRGQILFRFHLK